MGRGRVSVCLSFFVLAAIGLAVILASALLTARAQTFITEALAFNSRPVPPPPRSELCVDEARTLGSDPARLDLVRCALPRSNDKTTTATPPPTTGGTTQSGTPGAPQQGTVGTTQPGTTGASQPSTGTPAPSASGNPPAVGFAYYPPGDLDLHDANRGRKGDRKVYLPNIIFPLRLAPDQHPHMNSQIWGHGGGGWDGKGEAGGGECDPVNYDPMQQRDTYCEVRTWAMPMCPAGAGHQGQDIRPPTCKNDTWEAVAVVDGVITQVTSNTTVRLKGADGTDYLYLHMHPQSITVKVGQSVKQGDVLGRVSKYMDGDPNGTTMHLHFQVRQTIRVDGKILSVYIPGYTSLIAAYRKAKGLDPGISSDGNLNVDPELEIGAAKPAPTTTSQPPAPTPPAPATDQSASNAQPPGPTAGPVTPQPPAPTPPAPAVDQSAPSAQPPASTAGPVAPQSPASTPPATTVDQSAPSAQQPAPTAGPVTPQPPVPTPPAPAADQSAPSAQPPASTAGPVAPQPPAPTQPTSSADQSAPSAQPPPTPGPTPPTPTGSVPTSGQSAPTLPSSSSAPPPVAAPPQPPQSWWQRAWDSAKEWWNKLGK